MRKSVLTVLLISMVIIMPIAAFAADTQATQPQLEVLTLDKCLEIAYQDSKKLQSAAKTVEIAQEGVRIAESGLWPTVGYSLGANKYEKKQKTTGTDEGSQGSVSVTQNLYTGGATTSGIKMAKLKLDNALEDQRKAKQQLTFDVKSAYYQVWVDQQMVKVQQASYDNLAQHYQQMKNFYQVGTKSRYDLLQAEVNYQSIKPKLIQAQNTLAIDRMKLANTIGLDKDRQFTVSDEPSKVQTPEKAEFVLQDMLDQAYKNRPELRQLHNTDEIYKAQIQMDKAGYKPKVNVTGAYTGASGDYDPGNWDKSWSLTLGVQGNLFDGFKTPATVAKDKDTASQALLDESIKQDGIRLEVQQAVQDIKASQETILSTQANVGLSKENLRLTQSRFNAGMSTTMDIMDAELSLDTASNTYYSAVSAYLTALAKLDLAVGKDK